MKSEVLLHPYDPNAYYYLVTAGGVTYKSSDLDTLVRGTASHTTHKITKIGNVGFDLLKHDFS